jgi:hypothetical protein
MSKNNHQQQKKQAISTQAGLCAQGKEGRREPVSLLKQGRSANAGLQQRDCQFCFSRQALPSVAQEDLLEQLEVFGVLHRRARDGGDAPHDASHTGGVEALGAAPVVQGHQSDA